VSHSMCSMNSLRTTSILARCPRLAPRGRVGERPPASVARLRSAGRCRRRATARERWPSLSVR
jgi:hypothetical protein